MSRNILPEPPGELKQHSKKLSTRIREAIRETGSIPFSRYMEMALYEPGLGYYSAGLHKLGRSGDFVTSPELGSLFAACLAAQAEETGSRLGRYAVLEVGAGSGRLAADFLRQVKPEKAPDRYLILERSADLRQVQREMIAEQAPAWLDRVTWLDEPPVEQWRGLLIANEVIDALAAERFRVSKGRVEQVCVSDSETGFDWTTTPAAPELEAAVRHLESDTGKVFADAYCSEIQAQLPAWLHALTDNLVQGLALFIDYGYPRSEFYLPERCNGTLMCHYRHQAHDDPFFWPGLQDITSWVDFTALAEAADACGLEVEGYTSQSMFLLACGLERILQDKVDKSSDGGLALNNEVRQLTMPGMMGERFQVMGLGRELDREPAGFSLRDLRYRL
ncbi:MAG: SAM-dependent methyltransferase [Xanthomonadales bacterium]|jgi:SAM-dependent MidA family methyltransferase|nr:SAM-dependent methyltransferase [Xanthomonadales bacterium]